MKQCVLLVEDNGPIRENTAELLELFDYAVIVAKDGEQALEMITEKKPDLILCDIMMPKMDGYEFLKIIRQEYQLNNIPFIFFTAYSEKIEMQKGLQMGASDYIVKPFEPDILIFTIRKYLPAQVSSI
jgi:CRP/FNR family cyclic AMP-dependent transcriptional regulator